MEWLTLKADRIQLPPPVELSIKRSLFAASVSIRYSHLLADFAPGNESKKTKFLVVSGEASAKIPLKGQLKYSAESRSEIGPAISPFSFERFDENDSIGGSKTVWQRVENELQVTKTKGATTVQKPTLKVDPDDQATVLSPLQLSLALAHSWKPEAKTYGGFFVSGEKIKAIHLQVQNAERESVVLSFQISNLKVSTGPLDFNSANWSSQPAVELTYHPASERIQSVRFRVPVLGAVELSSDVPLS